MPRIDIAETIKLIDFPEKVWEWLDLFGDIVAANKFGYPDAFFSLT